MKLDFFKGNKTVVDKYKLITIFPDFLVSESKDLMIRGGKFYAVIDKSTGFWQQNERKIQEYVDEYLKEYAEDQIKKFPDYHFTIKDMMSYRSKSWVEYKSYVASLPDCYHQLDDRLCFDGEKIKREDYISKQLPYPLKKGPYESWDHLIGTLYSPEERQKIEWAIGSIITGDSKDIQKFIVLYGSPGAGKGTIIKIIQMMFPGYYEMFDAKSLSSNSNAFALEQFRSNPLIALQTDGDLSRIEDNTKINSLVSHETVVMNEKRKQSYNFTPRCFLFMASNKPVQITDGKSGLLRRLIDVTPTGQTIPKKEYDILMNNIQFELSGIAWHCREVYLNLGKNFYNGYKPVDMMEKTNVFYNFMEDNYDEFVTADKERGGIGSAEAYAMWKTYCEASGLQANYMPIHKFREELGVYFKNYEQRPYIKGEQKRNWFSGFYIEKFKNGTAGMKEIPHDDPTFGLVLDRKVSLLDEMLKDCQAQYGELKDDGGSKPKISWDNVETTLKNLDTRKLHFVRLPKNHIVIDFDLKNDKGEKDALLNLEAADKWPKTYAEYSQGGKGIHLHYIYDGDPDELASLYSKDIEIKVYKGKSSLRRKLIACNNIPVAVISCGLPKKEVQKDQLLDFESVKDEKHIRNIIAKCLKKDIAQPYTTPAMSLIKKTLDDAYDNGVNYDIRDMLPAIRAFAAKSHNQKQVCMKLCEELHLTGKNFSEEKKWDGSLSAKNETPKVDPIKDEEDTSIVFFDIEVFPNLLLVNWKEAGEGKGCVRMINPSKEEVAELLKKKLVGFNCRRYDNHILYARYIGYDIGAIYRLSQRIINGSSNAMFSNAYNISYTDVYDFAATKQSLKKWEIELGIHHKELGLPWDKPVPEERWAEVAEYCDNDVIATEAVFNKLSGDFKARKILADIAGMSVNDTTNMLTTRIIFLGDPKPQSVFNYPKLKDKFPNYIFKAGKSYYRHYNVHSKSLEEYNSLVKKFGSENVHPHSSWEECDVDVEIGEGGRVYAVPGIYHNVVTYDVASMHPSSIIAENGFGPYTERFKQLMDIRVAIKHKDFEKAKTMLDGKLAKYLTDVNQAKALSKALKIAINSVYGLTAAGFENKFRDPRNIDNWVAKRGALFMEQLRTEVTAMGATVVHIKTDSIKIENPTQKVTDYILKRGKEYGYTFEVEDIYEKICLVNDAVYIALRDKNDPGWIDECEKAKKEGGPEPTRWTATGAQFAHPYIFKTLFSHEPLDFKDLCETKTVTSALYLDMNENLSDPSEYEKELDKINKGLVKTYGKDWEDKLKEIPVSQNVRDILKMRSNLQESIAKCHKYEFVGKAGSFCPIKPGLGGGVLVREKDGKYYAATGSKGYRWREGESLVGADRMDLIDMTYFEDLANTAIKTINAFGNFEEFVSEVPVRKKSVPPLSIDEVLDKSDEMFANPPFDPDP